MMDPVCKAVTLTWLLASGPGTGYLVEVSGTPRTSVPAPPTTIELCFEDWVRVRAFDVAGNVGPWSPEFVPAEYDCTGDGAIGLPDFACFNSRVRALFGLAR